MVIYRLLLQGNEIGTLAIDENGNALSQYRSLQTGNRKRITIGRSSAAKMSTIDIVMNYLFGAFLGSASYKYERDRVIQEKEGMVSEVPKYQYLVNPDAIGVN
jgi:hypothetical protein